MAHKIIQWNCRGLRSNYNDLAILLQEGYSSAILLLSITRHALSPPPSHHHLYIIHLIN